MRVYFKNRVFIYQSINLFFNSTSGYKIIFNNR
jgi:hypothetical protein